jgi:hypothetical protein
LSKITKTIDIYEECSADDMHTTDIALYSLLPNCALKLLSKLVNGGFQHVRIDRVNLLYV